MVRSIRVVTGFPQPSLILLLASFSSFPLRCELRMKKEQIDLIVVTNVCKVGMSKVERRILFYQIVLL